MALLNGQAQYQIRHSNKEPEWSSICNNVFEEYLDTNDLFDFGSSHHERNSSDDSLNIFDFSGSSEQSHETEATSIYSWGPVLQQPIEAAKQPKPKEPSTFWTKTLKALEQNAAEFEREQGRLRSAKSHPDFLSLGGHPSPPAIPSSPADQSPFTQQRLPRAAQIGKRRNITARSLSRGRPTGVTKAAIAGCVNPHATIRKCSASPPKMMNPSRYRAGFKEAWFEKVQRSPKKYEYRRSSSPLFCTPPPSAQAPCEDDFGPFGSHSGVRTRFVFDEHISPLTNTFQHTHIHTPITSPSSNYVAHAANTNFEPLLPKPSNPYTPLTMTLNDTAPLYPERTYPLATSRMQSFDFGFLDVTSDDPRISSQGATEIEFVDSFSTSDPFGPFNASILPTTETFDIGTVGLDIGCDPSLLSSIPALHSASLLPATIYQPSQLDTTSYYLPSQRNGLPSTPHRRTRSCHRSQSPSPPPTETRSLRKASSSRRPSRHRRTKSTNSTPRHPLSPDKGAFVNFTADDSNKILSGVAPSGSSKTKARREKEAADKRRRLSQAAVRAVVEAGGDLDALSKSGLLA